MSEVHAASSEISQRDAVIATRVFTGTWPTTSEETVIRADSERSKTRISKYEIRRRAYEIYWARIASCNFQRQLSQESRVVSSASAGSYRPACGPVALEQADSANSGGEAQAPCRCLKQPVDCESHGEGHKYCPGGAFGIRSYRSPRRAPNDNPINVKTDVVSRP
jgi:hypothetical protein